MVNNRCKNKDSLIVIIVLKTRNRKSFLYLVGAHCSYGISEIKMSIHVHWCFIDNLSVIVVNTNLMNNYKLLMYLHSYSKNCASS